MGGEERHREERLRMVAEVGRDISDPQPAIGGTVVRMGLDEPGQRLGELSVPAAMFLEDRPGIVPGAEDQGVEQVAVRIDDD